MQNKAVQEQYKLMNLGSFRVSVGPRDMKQLECGCWMTEGV